MSSPTKSLILPLHSHSTMSILDGASSVDQYLKYCQDHGLPACGITDHGYSMGLHDLITKAPNYGVKAIPGCEYYLKPREDHQFVGDKPYDYFHLTVWAINLTGYKTLTTLTSRSWQDNRPVTRFGRKLPRLTFEDLATYNDGLIIGSGCIEGPIGKPLLRGERADAIRNFCILKEIFKDRMFMELMPHAVDRNYYKEETIQVSGEDGVIYRFGPKDQLLTEFGWQTAEEAMAMGASEITLTQPPRAQDGNLLDSARNLGNGESSTTISVSVMDRDVIVEPEEGVEE